MTSMPTRECKNRRPSFRGCRSYTYHVNKNGQLWVGGRCSLATALYAAGRLVEMAITDDETINVVVMDYRGKNHMYFANKSKADS